MRKNIILNRRSCSSLVRRTVRQLYVTLSIQWGHATPICSHLLNTSDEKDEAEKKLSTIIPDRWLYIPSKEN